MDNHTRKNLCFVLRLLIYVRIERILLKRIYTVCIIAFYNTRMCEMHVVPVTYLLLFGNFVVKQTKKRHIIATYRRIRQSLLRTLLISIKYNAAAHTHAHKILKRILIKLWNDLFSQYGRSSCWAFFSRMEIRKILFKLKLNFKRFVRSSKILW